MDNKDQPFQLFGTPLSKFLDNEPQESCKGPINRRRARLDRQQTVQDEQGRRRFHGAFTGGFSAGYHGTVDTIQGFRPKSFSVHRSSKRHDGGESSSIRFEHRPEDYMDDEDFDEFGIAPKKVRLAGNYSGSSYNLLAGGIHNARTSIVVADSIGVKILRSMTCKRRYNDEVIDQPVRQKTDFHGLGYKPLIESKPVIYDINQSAKNPLVASLNHGKRLRISGEAFGEGILDDDGDNLFGLDEYGHDSMNNYEFPKSKSLTTSKHERKSVKLNKISDISNDDLHELNGFILVSDFDSQKICDDYHSKYPIPLIEESWKMPVRSEPIKHHKLESEFNRQNLTFYHRQSNSFNEKFTTSTSKLMKCDSDIESRSGLVPYSHLKALEAKSKTSNEFVNDPRISSISIDNKKVIEWRPCSLLCKHFEVQNPYPDNEYCGSKPADLISSLDSLSSALNSKNRKPCNEKLAPIELKQSIFNISFDESNSCTENDCDNSDDEPKVVICDLEVKSIDYECNSRNKADIVIHEQKVSDQEPDIILVDVPKPSPEVIVLSSSSSESGCSTPVTDRGDRDEDNDTYGPPLPPTREILEDLDRAAKPHQSTSRFSSKFTGKKSKKRNKSKNKKHKSRKEEHSRHAP